MTCIINKPVQIKLYSSWISWVYTKLSLRNHLLCFFCIFVRDATKREQCTLEVQQCIALQDSVQKMKNFIQHSSFQILLVSSCEKNIVLSWMILTFTTANVHPYPIKFYLPTDASENTATLSCACIVIGNEN